MRSSLSRVASMQPYTSAPVPAAAATNSSTGVSNEMKPPPTTTMSTRPSSSQRTTSRPTRLQSAIPGGTRTPSSSGRPRSAETARMRARTSRTRPVMKWRLAYPSSTRKKAGWRMKSSSTPSTSKRSKHSQMMPVTKARFPGWA